jgi:hypothetical protein
MKKKELKVKLINFLIDNNAHESFINALNDMGEDINTIDQLVEQEINTPSQIFLGAFYWAHTINGNDYWANLSKKWINTL